MYTLTTEFHTVFFCPVSQEKVDCIIVNCEPVKATIDDLIQRLFDLLLSSLRKSIQGRHRHMIFLSLSLFSLTQWTYIYRAFTLQTCFPSVIYFWCSVVSFLILHSFASILIFSLFFHFPFHSSSPLPPLLLGHTQAIHSFVSESMEALSTRPESMEEIGAANGKYNQILTHKPEVRCVHSQSFIRNFY